MGFLEDNAANQAAGRPYVVQYGTATVVFNPATGQSMPVDQYNAGVRPPWVAAPAAPTAPPAAWAPPAAPPASPPAPVAPPHPPPPPLPPPPAPDPGVVPAHVADPNAVAQIQNVLADYGLGNMAQWAWNEVVAGATPDQITQDLRLTPQYEQRFPGLNAMRQKGQGLTETEWITYEKTARSLFKQFQLPAGFGDQAENIAGYIENNVSTAELQTRLQWAEDAANRQYDVQAGQMFGLAPGAFTAMILDPTAAQSLVERDWRAAQAGSIAGAAGMPTLNASDAELATLNKPTEADLTTKFGQLAAEQQMLTPLALNQGSAPISTTEQIQAQFQNNAQAQSDIAKAKAGRLAPFQEGGTFAKGTAQDRGFTGTR